MKGPSRAPISLILYLIYVLFYYKHDKDEVQYTDQCFECHQTYMPHIALAFIMTKDVSYIQVL